MRRHHLISEPRPEADRERVRRTLWARVWRIARSGLAIWSLSAAMYQLVMIDHQLITFAVYFTFPPILVVWLDVSVPMRPFSRRVVLIYLVLLGLGTWIAAHPHFLPGLGAPHPGDTDFANRWNELDVVPRRLISWNMALSSALLFWWLGYGTGWRPLVDRHTARSRVRIRPSIAIAAIGVMWGLPLLILLSFLISLGLSSPGQ